MYVAMLLLAIFRSLRRSGHSDRRRDHRFHRRPSPGNGFGVAVFDVRAEAVDPEHVETASVVVQSLLETLDISVVSVSIDVVMMWEWRLETLQMRSDLSQKHAAEAKRLHFEIGVVVFLENAAIESAQDEADDDVEARRSNVT